MNDDDRNAFGTSMVALGVVFNQPVDGVMLDAYWLFLSGLDKTAFGAAVFAAGRTLKWFPKPAELLELAGAGATARRGEVADAWEAVRTAMDRYDYIHSVDFGALVNAVVRNLGGWQALCARSSRELIWERKRFEEIYELFSISKAELRGDPLPGYFGGKPTRIAIGGKLPPLRIEPVDTAVQLTVRDLAWRKCIGAGDAVMVAGIGDDAATCERPGAGKGRV